MNKTPLLLAVVALLPLVVSCSKTEGPPAPEIAEGRSRSDLILEVLELDLGNVFQSISYPLEFPFRVSGPDPILIQELDSSCGCTQVRIRADWDPSHEGDWPLDKEIPSGAEGTVIATFDGTKYEKNRASTITLRGNFLSNKIALGVTAYVIPVFERSPENLLFGQLQISQLDGAKVAREVEVIGMKEFQVVRWKRVAPGLVVQEIGEGVALEDTRFRRTFEVVATSDLPEGRLATSLIAETTLDRDLEILVNGTVLGALKYAPDSRIPFGIFNAGTKRTRTLKIESTGLEIPEPTIELAGNAADVMEATLKATQPGRLYEVKIVIAESALPGSYAGVLRVSFPEESKLRPKEIAITARVR